MKRSILMLAAFIFAGSGFAQTSCSKDNPLFKFDKDATPTEVRTLGSAPEFPFLGNMSSSRQVYNMIKKCEKDGTHRRELSQLNDMLVQIGFANGIKDLTPSSIQMETLPSGTVGNMGNRNFTIVYSKLEGNPNGYKSWKISSGSGCYMYLLARCGNAFFPGTSEKTACLDVPVNLNSQPQEITVKPVTANVSDKTYVFFHVKGRKQKFRETSSLRSEMPDSNPSHPLLLSTVKSSRAVPETYKITVSTPDDRLKVCPDKQLDVAANINVEKTSEYTGNYRSTNKEYKLVSKRAYKKALRKMEKIDKKENKVAEVTHVHVNR